MNELIDKLVQEAGISKEQAEKSLQVIVDFVKEKFPMLGGAVDNIFGSN
jgi:nucleoid DNA-binding protein